jgi:hypothetical protein
VIFPWATRLWPEAAKPQEPVAEQLLDVAPLPVADVIARGEAATRLLQDPVLSGAFDEILQDTVRLWLDSNPSEEVRREELYRVTLAVQLLRGKLRAYKGAASVRLAEREAEAREEARGRSAA